MWTWLNNLPDHALGVWGLFLAVCAGIGVGSVIAAWIGRGVSIGQHRQDWINAIRDDLVEYLRCLDILYQLHAELNDKPNRDGSEVLTKFREARIDVLRLYRRIQLRLNVDEKKSQRLLEQMDGLHIVETKIVNPVKINEIIDSARELLRYEWAVTKYGSGLYLKLLILRKRLFNQPYRHLTDN
jgi:hypothetical protein